MENNKYKQFKRILIDAWPNGKTYNAVIMAMIDFDIPWSDSIGGNDWDLCDDFVASINMPGRFPPERRRPGFISYISMDVTVYIATFYPQTSAMLFDGASKDAAFAVVLKEKRKPAPKSSPRIREMRKRRYEDSKDRASITIRARSLDKKNDWNTVK